MQAREMWRLRDVLREHNDAPRRLRHCGRTRYQKTATLVTSSSSAWWQGVVCCRSRICPVCWVARRARAATEIAFVAEQREQETRCQPFMVTMTVRHHMGDPISLVRGVRKAWRSMLQRRRWRSWAAENQIEWICAEEVTRGPNGWHPHLHLLVLPGRELQDSCDWLELSGEWFEQWAAIVEQKLGPAHVPLPDYGTDLRPIHVTDYLTKIGLELSDANAIKGDAPLALLERGELELYVGLQLERTRARDLTFSRGLKSLRERGLDVGPAELPAELLELSGSDWGLLLHMSPYAPLDIARAAHDPETAQLAARWFLDGHASRLKIEPVNATTTERSNEQARRLSPGAHHGRDRG